MNITDEMLYEAASQAAERWLDTLPEQEDCGHDFSLTFQASMKPLLRRKRRLRRGLVPLAAVIVVLAGLLAFSVSADKPDEYQLYAAQEDNYVSYLVRPKNSGEDQAIHQLTPQWVPEGFFLTDINIRDDHTTMDYSPSGDRENAFLYLEQWHGTEQANTMMGHFQLEDVTVNGDRAVLISDEGASLQYLLWVQGSDAFILLAKGVEKEDILRFANNLKW